MNRKLVIFDLDGTLLNTIADLSAAVDYALGQYGLKGHSVDEYIWMVGNGIRKLIERALEKSMGKTPSEEMTDNALAMFTEYYLKHIDVLTRPYPGVHDVLKSLSDNGVKVAIASNKFQEGAEYLVKEFFGDIDFVAILGGRADLPLKPSAEVVDLILSKCGLTREDAVFVGDSATDIKTAANAGIPCVAVSWGFRPESFLVEAGAEHIAGNAAELAAFLESF